MEFRKTHRRTKRLLGTQHRSYAIAAICLLAASVVMLAGCDRPSAGAETPTRGMSLQQISKLPPSADDADKARLLHPIQYSTPQTPRVATDQVDALGHPITISCASCHSNFSERTPVVSAEKLQAFHVGLKFQHGSPNQQLTCLTCHHADNYNYLRLADGQPVEFRNSRSMCAQCHAAQDRDYEHGAHGGMNGYWDRVQGIQVRKTCIDCHDPHSPQFPHMLPNFKPLDRFLEPSLHHNQHEQKH
jgi:formate-dependent nitrite reductase cytochrome c552 subunit